MVLTTPRTGLRTSNMSSTVSAAFTSASALLHRRRLDLFVAPAQQPPTSPREYRPPTPGALSPSLVQSLLAPLRLRPGLAAASGRGLRGVQLIPRRLHVQPRQPVVQSGQELPLLHRSPSFSRRYRFSSPSILTTTTRSAGTFSPSLISVPTMSSTPSRWAGTWMTSRRGRRRAAGLSVPPRRRRRPPPDGRWVPGCGRPRRAASESP